MIGPEGGREERASEAGGVSDNRLIFQCAARLSVRPQRGL